MPMRKLKPRQLLMLLVAAALAAAACAVIDAAYLRQVQEFVRLAN